MELPSIHWSSNNPCVMCLWTKPFWTVSCCWTKLIWSPALEFYHSNKRSLIFQVLPYLRKYHPFHLLELEIGSFREVWSENHMIFVSAFKKDIWISKTDQVLYKVLKGRPWKLLFWASFGSLATPHRRDGLTISLLFRSPGELFIKIWATRRNFFNQTRIFLSLVTTRAESAHKSRFVIRDIRWE